MSGKPAIRRALVIYKTSPYDRYDELGVLPGNVDPCPDEAPGQALILERLRTAHLANQGAIAQVQATLARSSIKVIERQQPTKREASGVDLVITVGGDGTFLATAQRVEQALMLGVNSAPGSSTGHYCATDAAGFEESLDALCAGEAPVAELERIACRVNGRALPYQALNDILVAHRSPASSTRYLLAIDGTEELQTSSGLWISTASGASGAMRSAGGGDMDFGVGELQYLVREPYVRPGRHVSLRRGITTRPITVISRNQKLQVFMDGYARTQSVNFGSELSLRVSPRPLRVVGYRHGGSVSGSAANPSV